MADSLTAQEQIAEAVRSHLDDVMQRQERAMLGVIGSFTVAQGAESSPRADEIIAKAKEALQRLKGAGERAGKEMPTRVLVSSLMQDELKGFILPPVEMPGLRRGETLVCGAHFARCLHQAWPLELVEILSETSAYYRLAFHTPGSIPRAHDPLMLPPFVERAA